MDSDRFSDLRVELSEIIYKKLLEFINAHKDDDCLSELEAYIEDIKRNGYAWDIDKIKIVLSAVKLRGGDTAAEILSYLKQSEYGWQGDKYRLFNSCLRFDSRCKRNQKVDNSPDATSWAFEDIEYIFLHEKYGGITSYLFCYSLAALFSSKLKSDNMRVPYFLQIACERNSNMYRLIHEIVDICDVNTGIINCCQLEVYHRGYCEYEHVTLFPTQSAEKALNDLMYHRDTAVVVDGYDNEKYYNSLLREVANVPGKKRDLDVRDRFNVLPIFVCSTIVSQYRNVISMDLTGLDVSNDYLNAIQENKQRLASWVFELVQNAGEWIFRNNYQKNEMRNDPKKESPLFNNINRHISQIRKEYRHCEELSQIDMTNIGLLSYFWEQYMRVFRSSIQLPDNTEFEYRRNYEAHSQRELIKGITREAVEALIAVHNVYSPRLPQTVDIAVDSKAIDSRKARQLKNKGEQYGREIVKCYQSYGVSIRILPGAEYRDERYVFPVKMLPGTNKSSISRHADDVRRLLGVEFFAADIASSSIKLIASEKPLKENSLIKMLESQQFARSKMEIPYAVGYDIMGEMVFADVAEFPHLLIGGTSGSGKSSAIHSLLMSIVYRQPADKVKLLLLDFGSSRLNMFANVPHMLVPGATIRDASEGHQSILYLQKEMERRLKKLDSVDARAYDAELRRWPSIICVIDEFPAFIQQSQGQRGNKKASTVISDLLSRARKVKIHLVLAAQDVTQGNIEVKHTNLAARMAFRCTNWHASRAIIGDSDAENLSGKGSMYFKCEQHEGIRRVQGSFMPPEEIMDLLDQLEFTYSNPARKYDEVEFETTSIQKSISVKTPSNLSSAADDDEKRLVEIVENILDEKLETLSNNQLKCRFQMGYDVANRFLKRLEELEIIDKLEKRMKKSRKVNMDKAREFLQSYGRN